MQTRRRFLTIAAASLLPLNGRAAPVHVETAQALGARVTLRLEHPEARALATEAMGEIRRLEAIFSLYLPQSALVRLNGAGVLDAPPGELLECLSLAGAVHRASGGAFDPTVQPLWQAEAEATVRSKPLSLAARAEVRARIGWDGVALSPNQICLRAGQSLTLNGIAQGVIADRVARLLAGRGLTHALIDTGEMVALPGRAWPVRLPSGGDYALAGRALATSAPGGMTFGGDSQRSHILDPKTGASVRPVWHAVSISAPSAALADALSTAACLMPDRAALQRLCAAFPSVRLEAAVPA